LYGNNLMFYFLHMTLRFRRLLALLFVLGSLPYMIIAQTVNYIINPTTDVGFEWASSCN
jgi:hypothetical protein